MIEIPLIKCHGSGNDFLLIDELSGVRIAEDHKAILSRDLCNRHLGFGADGVLFLSHTTKGDCSMRMFNPDGSEAQMCGNGLRCAARYYCEQNNLQQVEIVTPQARLTCMHDSVRKGVPFYRTQIGPVSIDPTSLPATQKKPIVAQIIPELDDSIAWYGLSITNPHLVAIVDSERQSAIAHIGERARTLALFPEGINCSLISLKGDNDLFVTTYERGAGLTNACGTAMAASCFIATYTGARPANSTVTIHNPGGYVIAESSGVLGSMVWLAGNATFVYSSFCCYDPESGRMAGEPGRYRALVS